MKNKQHLPISGHIFASFFFLSHSRFLCSCSSNTCSCYSPLCFFGQLIQQWFVELRDVKLFGENTLLELRDVGQKLSLVFCIVELVLKLSVIIGGQGYLSDFQPFCFRVREQTALVCVSFFNEFVVSLETTNSEWREMLSEIIIMSSGIISFFIMLSNISGYNDIAIELR